MTPYVPTVIPEIPFIRIQNRTGIIPFTTVAIREVLSVREKSDLNQEDAMKRVQKQASLAALGVVMEEFAGFMKAVP